MELNINIQNLGVPISGYAYFSYIYEESRLIKNNLKKVSDFAFQIKKHHYNNGVIKNEHQPIHYMKEKIEKKKCTWLPYKSYELNTIVM